MSSFGTSSGIKALDSASLDAFGRWRTSEPSTIFESQLQYDDRPIFWETILFGSGATNMLMDESALELSVGTAATDRVIRQTYQYFRYQSGKSQLILCTAVLGLGKTNVIKRVGIYDGYNGLYFEQNGELSVGLRTSTSGMVDDTVIAQNKWNIDKMDGSGPSSVTIDSSKSHIFIIDFEWLGVGRVRYGFVVNGVIYYCHEINNANIRDSVYMATPNLPLRYEIENIDVTASSTSMKQICSTIISEGGFENDKGIDRAVGNAATGQSVTTRAAVLSIRPKNIYGGIKNRGNIIPLEFSIFAQTNSVYYEIVYKGSLNSGSWSSVDSDSITEYSTTSNTVSGGIIISSGYIGATGPGSNAVGLTSSSVKLKYTLGSNYDGTAQDELSIVCTSLSATATVYSSITFKERF